MPLIRQSRFRSGNIRSSPDAVMYEMSPRSRPWSCYIGAAGLDRSYPLVS